MQTVNGAKYCIGFFSKHVTMHDEQKADVKLDQETYALLTSLTKQLNLTYTLQLKKVQNVVFFVFSIYIMKTYVSKKINASPPYI